MKFLILSFLTIFSFLTLSTCQLVSSPNTNKWISIPKDKPLAVNPDPNVIFPMVTTPLGQLRGVSMLSRLGKPYYAYRGIPYAQPPSRFQPSVMVEPWEGLLDAREDGAVCPQVPQTGSSAEVIGEENCLSINVFFPHYDRCQNESETGLLPVYFFIHGGGFYALSGSFSGSKYLLDECIVYASINYRLGALGFLTTGDDVIPGNLGLKDQVLALQWARDYISYFRGDPNHININGVSAGGASVSHLIASPMAKGLFVNAISSSGCVMNSFTIQKEPLKHAKELAQNVNCSSTDTSQELRDCLLSIDAKTIIENQGTGEFNFVLFAPTIEPKTAVSPFQTEHPAVVMRNGDFNQVPLMIGFLEDEGVMTAESFLIDPAMTSLINNSWNQIAPAFFAYDELGIEQMELNRISSEIRQFFFGDKDIGPETRKALVDLSSDRTFVQGTLELVELHSKFAPVYAYVNTYKGSSSGANSMGYEVPGIWRGTYFESDGI